MELVFTGSNTVAMSYVDLEYLKLLASVAG